MKLSRLAASVPSARLVGADADIRAVTSDSRAVATGDLFVAVRGRRADGHGFVPTAVERGAAAVAVEREVPGLRVPQVVVPDGQRALGHLVGAAAGAPAARLTAVGVTGTNGKTTSTFVLEHVLAAAGHRPGVIGTVNYRWAGRTVDAPYSTPTPEVLHGTLAEMVAAGTSHAVMEVTSAALAMHRVAGLRFAVAGFTNLTQDHLDVHGTMEAYRAAKELLFRDYLADDGTAVIDVDDPAGAAMVAATRAGGARRRVLRVSVDAADADAELRPEQREAEIRVLAYTSSVDGVWARLATPAGELELTARPLLGRYNVANLALVVGIALALGLTPDAIARAVATLPGVPGRLERVANPAGLDLIVDYAHTPDALDNVLRTLRPVTRRRLLCVFGCGGDRDPTKRPKMGAVVAAHADLAVVTSDNPRTEDPRAIIEMILPAVPRPFYVDVDRRTAIRAAVAEATPGDVVLIAGKGHEDYQILGTTKIHFDDREEAAAAAALRPRWTVAQLAAECGGAVRGDGETAVSRIVIDGRAAAPGDLYVAVRGQRFDGHDFVAQARAAGAAAVLVEPGRAPADAPAVEVAEPQEALAAIAGAHRARWGAADATRRVIAITGSAGKTTTKELTRAALAGAGATLAAVGSLNNETGVPLTLLGLRAQHHYGVIEMGMRGRGQIEYLTRFTRPDVAVVVNAGTAHIELLGSTDAIAAAKAEIYLGLPATGVAVAPADDDRLTARARGHGARLLTFGEAASADVRLVGYHPFGPGGADLHVDVAGARRRFRLPMIGRHNAVDATCALAAALAAGVDLDVAVAGLERARPAAMRSEVQDIGGRHVIVDCYNANPASMAAAIDTLMELRGSARAVAVVGDMLELGDHARDAHAALGERLGELGVPVIALGEHKRTVAEATGAPALAWTTDDPAAAARQVLAITEPGDWVLVKGSRGMRLERVIAALAETAA
ncbi:MAG: UDP-N-acetylmuramoyl-L-alanyl-D-glutamate--2,6-diaminopimelate ligase [Kofleriaceae bacterium]|nr:UDP-N-acetylmuramoyl-L-alanyl-D-glutamate--2,6-diaminopimelate ligase [Kofleriaceae bacterium]MCL4226583.1 UDP-N-acetylmuramoyl-L-alanyl-D-glutamate--2,6-diaminopimelate ligase [Myxococcales bacterium]